MLQDEISMKLLGKLTLEYPTIFTEQKKIKYLIDEVLNNYDITSRETGLVKTDLPEKIQMFLAVRQLDGLSRKTLYNYKMSLQKFFEYVPKPVNFITTTDIRIYLSQTCQHKKKSSIATEISTLKAFFGWLALEEIIEKNPMLKIKQTKVSKHMRKALTVDEIELLRDSCKNTRQRALLETLYATACRLDEIAKLNKTDIDFNSMKVRVIGKGDKERIVYVSPKAKLYLQKYFNERVDNCEALFVGKRRPSSRLCKRSIQKEINTIALQANIDKRVYPHILRHSFATHALASGMAIDVIQKILGHTDPATTQIYSRLNDNVVQNEYKKLNF